MVNKIIEVQSRSSEGWEHAAQTAINEVARSVQDIRSIYIQDLSAVVNDNNEITEYRINAKVTFEVNS